MRKSRTKKNRSIIIQKKETRVSYNMSMTWNLILILPRDPLLSSSCSFMPERKADLISSFLPRGDKVRCESIKPNEGITFTSYFRLLVSGFNGEDSEWLDHFSGFLERFLSRKTRWMRRSETLRDRDGTVNQWAQKCNPVRAYAFSPEPFLSHSLSPIVFPTKK